MSREYKKREKYITAFFLDRLIYYILYKSVYSFLTWTDWMSSSSLSDSLVIIQGLIIIKNNSINDNNIIKFLKIGCKQYERVWGKNVTLQPPPPLNTPLNGNNNNINHNNYNDFNNDYIYRSNRGTLIITWQCRCLPAFPP